MDERINFKRSTKIKLERQKRPVMTMIPAERDERFNFESG